MFLILVVGGGLAIGASTIPGEWYAGLEKPAINPPNWVFAPVWTALYLIISFVGWRIWARNGSSHLMRLWGLQLVLNFLWSPAFFALKSPVTALVIIVCLLFAIAEFIRRSWRADQISGILFVPYFAWVTYASILNAAIVVLNVELLWP